MKPNARLIGTGTALPMRIVTSDETDASAGRPAGWLSSRCGVDSRRVRTSETQEGLAVEAVAAALAGARIEVEELDALICAHAVGRQPIPALAPLVAAGLGLPVGRMTTFDVNATCLSFLTAFAIVDAMIASGRCRTVAIVSSEIPSAALPWDTDPATAGHFGDGAAAAIVTASDGDGYAFKASRFETHHDGYDFCRLRSGGTAVDRIADPQAFALGSLFEMDGHRLYRMVAARFPSFLAKLLEEAGWRSGDVDVVVPHQASQLALRHMREKCGFEPGLVIDIMADHGNQVAASIPTALHVARRRGLVGPGAKVLMVGTSAGVMFGGIALEMGG